MYRFEVYGRTQDGKEWVECKTIAPFCQNAYQASLYVTGKYGDGFIIDHDRIFKILE